MKLLHIISFLLVIVGALNWGLVGISSFTGGDLNVVHMILGGMPQVEALVYVLVGLSGIYLLATHKKGCMECK